MRDGRKSNKGGIPVKPAGSKYRCNLLGDEQGSIKVANQKGPDDGGQPKPFPSLLAQTPALPVLPQPERLPPYSRGERLSGFAAVSPLIAPPTDCCTLLGVIPPHLLWSLGLSPTRVDVSTRDGLLWVSWTSSISSGMPARTRDDAIEQRGILRVTRRVAHLYRIHLDRSTPTSIGAP